jgi:hypothetical protein
MNKTWFGHALVALCLAEACARATDEKLLGSGDDDSGGSSGSATGGSSGKGGTPSSGGSSGKGGASTGGTAGQGGKGGASSGAGGASDGGASDGGEGGIDPCSVVGTPPALRVDTQARPVPVTNDPDIELRLRNGTNDAIPLTDLAIRYWFQSEFTCAETTDSMMVNITHFSVQPPFVGKSNSDVTTRVVTLGTGSPGCDAYFELGFAASAGSLETAQFATITLFAQLGLFTRPHNQANDWSYGACTTTPVYWDKITLYRDGRLVSGREPDGAGGEGGTGGDGGAGMGGI